MVSAVGKKTSTLKDRGDAINDPNAESSNSVTFHSMDSEEDEGEGSPRRLKRYLEWKPKQDIKENVELSVGLKFAYPTEFKQTLEVFAMQKSFDYKYQHTEKTWVSTVCKNTVT